MAKVLDALRTLARRTGFGDLLVLPPEEALPPVPGDTHILRLRQWPLLPAGMRRAPVLRLLSLMSSRPVSRAWLLQHGGLEHGEVDQLLELLQRQQALEVTDPAAFSAQARR